MKIYTAYLAHESNSFSPLPTTLQSYRDAGMYLPSTGEGKEILDGDRIAELSDDLSMIRMLQTRGHEVHIGPIAASTPSAPTRQADYEFLRGELTGALEAALPVDAVVLFMHGAQMAEGYTDCGGDILQRIRALVGPEVPVGVELDLHCNVSPLMVEQADVIIACKEYPHTDFENEAANLIRIIEQAAAGQCKPVMALAPVPMLGYFHTTREPMRTLVDDVIAQEQQDGILSVSICHGFGLGDSPHTAAGVLVVADDDQQEAGQQEAGQQEAGQQRARRLADQLAERVFSVREHIRAPVWTVNEAMDEIAQHKRGTLVLADTTDNPGGGAAGDATFILQALIDRGIKDAAMALLWDPEVVALASKAGVGSQLPVRLGGKTGPGSGDVVDAVATVRAVRTDAWQSMFGARSPLGAAVALQIDGITVVVNSIRQQTFEPRCFTEFGIDPWALKVVVVKSAQHFHAAFSPRAERIVYVDAPGTVTADFGKLPYTRLVRPVWPIDQPPFEAYGRTWR